MREGRCGNVVPLLLFRRPSSGRRGSPGPPSRCFPWKCAAFWSFSFRKGPPKTLPTD